MECRICKKESEFKFSSKILDKYDIKYFHCSNCGFLQTEEPFWLEESYDESINVSDTGIISRNLNLSQVSTLIIFFFFSKKKKFLDFAGGYGFFTRLMRDIGLDFYWNDKYSPNLVARGFEDDNKSDYELITSFETFEHFEDPIAEIEKMLEVSKNILFSTQLFSGDTPSQDWYYYGFGHGQHISFYSPKTLDYIAKKYSLNLYSNGNNLHLLTAKKLNRFYFKMILKLNKIGLFYVIRRLLKSKTQDDWAYLK